MDSYLTPYIPILVLLILAGVLCTVIAFLATTLGPKRIFGVMQENGRLKTVRQIGTIPQQLVSFATDEAGHIYAVGYEGMVYQLDFSETRFE